MGVKKTRLTPETFNKVKMLQTAGVTTSMAVQISGLSQPSVNRIYRHNTWGDYKAWRDEQTRKYHPKPKTPAPASVEVPRQDKPVETEELPPAVQNEWRTIKALNRIGDQLERLADAWEAEPKKTGFFKK